jgi:hypothetical protein
MELADDDRQRGDLRSHGGHNRCETLLRLTERIPVLAH